MKLTKSAYLSYLECPREFWLNHHRPDLFAKPLSPEHIHRIRVGYGVQAQARNLFGRGGFGECEFEKPFETERLSTRADIFAADQRTGKNAIYEVKSTKSVKDEHIDDIAFQKITAEMAGVPVERTFLVHLSGDYVRRGAVEPEKLLAIADVTGLVNEKLDETRRHIENAFRYLEIEEPSTSIAEYCRARKLDCAFIRHAHAELPEYTIFDIKRFYGKKFDQLLGMGVLDIMDVPADFELNPKMRKQVKAAQSGEVIASAEEIRGMIGTLEYPLYFLDYETVNYAIPLFDGYKPYQQMVFQFSLHIQEEKEGELRHCEFLANCLGEPAAEVLKALKQHIAHEGGTVIVWFKEFEKSRNSEMAGLFAEHADFMHSVNERVFDLMKIFDDGHYVHPKFKGSASIKKILPVLAPDLSYDDLEISHGMLASISWLDMLLGETPEELHEQTRENLLKYCKMDTRAMAEIFNFLRREFCP
jgi:hypothetical protein